MPYIIGQVDQAEKERIVKAGYELFDTYIVRNAIRVGTVYSPGPVRYETIAVWVDCDVEKLLVIGEASAI